MPVANHYDCYREYCNWHAGSIATHMIIAIYNGATPRDGRGIALEIMAAHSLIDEGEFRECDWQQWRYAAIWA